VLRQPVASRFDATSTPISSFVANQAETYSAEARRTAVCEVTNTMAPLGLASKMDLRMRRQHLSEMAEKQGTILNWLRPQPSTGIAHAQRADDGMDDGIELRDHERIEDRRSIARVGRKVIQSFLRHALRDGFFMPICTRANLLIDDTAGLLQLISDHGPVGARSGASSPILLGFITGNSRRAAKCFRGRLCTRASFGGEFCAHPRIGEPIHNSTPKRFRWRSC